MKHRQIIWNKIGKSHLCLMGVLNNATNMQQKNAVPIFSSESKVRSSGKEGRNESEALVMNHCSCKQIRLLFWPFVLAHCLFRYAFRCSKDIKQKAAKNDWMIELIRMKWDTYTTQQTPFSPFIFGILGVYIQIISYLNTRVSLSPAPPFQEDPASNCLLVGTWY